MDIIIKTVANIMILFIVSSFAFRFVLLWRLSDPLTPRYYFMITSKRTLMLAFAASE